MTKLQSFISIPHATLNKYISYSLALRILFAMWVMYSLGSTFVVATRYVVIISKCSYIENKCIQNSFRFTHNIHVDL